MEQRQRDAEKIALHRESLRPPTSSGAHKTAELMLNALGILRRRQMVARIKHGGAMSVSRLAKPFHMTLPSALEHVRILEHCGIIKTHKRGRVRMCVYNPRALKELAKYLARFD